jgi:flagellin
MRLNHNLASLNIYKEHVKTLKGQSASITKISSGNKVNSAGDNPNALAQSERLRIQIRGLQMAQRNVQDGVSMLQTAEGGLDNVTSALHRLKELTVQSGGSTSSEDKEVIQREIEQLIKGINDTVKNTEFNGVKLIGDKTIDGTLDEKGRPYDNKENPKEIFMSSGANVGEKIAIPVYNISSERLGNDTGNPATSKYLDDIEITQSGGLDEALNIIDGAISMVLSISSKYGALENRFDSVYNIVDAVGMDIQKAESDLRDADVAYEMMGYAKYNLLMESGNAMMIQANKFPQDILRILENVK